MADLPAADVAQASTMLRLLEAGGWIDAQTRAVFVEFSVYYPPADLVLSARLVLEVHPTGSIWPDMLLEPICLTVYTLDNAGMMTIQIVGLVVAFAAMCWELWHIRSMRMHTGTPSGAVRFWLGPVCLSFMAVVTFARGTARALRTHALCSFCHHLAVVAASGRGRTEVECLWLAITGGCVLLCRPFCGQR